MANNTTMETDPLQSIFPDIKKILEFVEFKNLEEANKYETDESRGAAEIYLNAMIGRDSYVTYKNWWDISMFLECKNSITDEEFDLYFDNPYNVPLTWRDTILERSRQAFMDQYVETNTYYRMLQGLPAIDDRVIFYMGEDLEEQFEAPHKPIHEQSEYIQSLYMNTDAYKKLVETHPDKGYLRYLGNYKIDLYTARHAKDFDIIRYPVGRADINPNLLSAFSQLYEDYREYVMVVLYQKHLENIYKGYRSFMGLLIIFCVLLQIGNKAIESVNTHNYLDDTILHIILSLYGIPDSLLMTKDVRRRLAINILKLVREKGTSQVYYDLIDILGYQDVVISKLMLMKGQDFDTALHPDKTSVYFYIKDRRDLIEFYDTEFERADGYFNENGELILYENEDRVFWDATRFHFWIHGMNLWVSHESADGDTVLGDFNPYFLQLDLKDKNPYETIAEGRAPIYSYHEIVDNDPLWWDLKDVRDILHKYKYSISDSKYIVIEAVIHQMEYLFETIFFSRMILDNKASTNSFMIEIPELFGTELVSAFDLVLFITCATCMSNNLSGELFEYDDEMLATAGFNFDINIEELNEYLDTARYVEVERVKKFTRNLNITTADDIPRLFNDVLYPMREWLENKIASASSRQEYLEYEAIYKAMFTYDVSRNKFIDDFEMPIVVIRKKYGLTDDELIAYQHFYPQDVDGNAATVEYYNNLTNITKYKWPFLSEDNRIDWYVHITVETPYGTDDRGNLYFHDILNCNDVTKLEVGDGRRIFMDYKSEETGWEINQKAVDQALYLIDQLEDDALSKAYFQIYTKADGLDDGKTSFAAGEKLPAILRSGIYKDILKEKIQMDVAGLNEPPKTYFEALYRENETLYHLLTDNDRFHKDRNAWTNDVMAIVLAVESGLSVHMKYFEQSVLGEELFFRPLITLIKHFKSIYVDIAKTGLRYEFADKMDSGGNSNMFKIFDEIDMTDHHIWIGDPFNETPFGLYDTEHMMEHFIILKDMTEILKYTVGEGFAAEERTASMGSMRMVDEVKLFKNNTELDPSGQYAYWQEGEYGLGRWTDDDDFLMRARKDVQHITNVTPDLEGWKDYVVSISEEDEEELEEYYNDDDDE